MKKWVFNQTNTNILKKYISNKKQIVVIIDENDGLVFSDGSKKPLIMHTHKIKKYCNGKFRSRDAIRADKVGPCPRCGDNLPLGYPGAMSRIDNKTEICPECGIQEATYDFIKRGMR